MLKVLLMTVTVPIRLRSRVAQVSVLVTVVTVFTKQFTCDRVRAGTRRPVRCAALETLVHAAARRSGLISQRVSEFSAFPVVVAVSSHDRVMDEIRVRTGMPVSGAALENLENTAVSGRGFVTGRVAETSPFVSCAPVCSKHRTMHVIAAGTRRPVRCAALERLIHATVSRGGFFARRVAHLAAFPALSFPHVTDATGHPVCAGRRVEVDRASGEVLVCAAARSVFHLIVERPTQRAAFCFCALIAFEDFAPNGVCASPATPTDLTVLIGLYRAGNARDRPVCFIGRGEPERPVLPLVGAVGPVDSAARSVSTILGGPVDLTTTIELNERAVTQRDQPGRRRAEDTVLAAHFLPMLADEVGCGRRSGGRCWRGCHCGRRSGGGG